MHPVRFAFDSWETSHIAYGRYVYAWMADSGGRWAASHPAWLSWDIVSMMDRGYDCGISSATLGPNSHLSDMDVSGFALRPAAFLGRLSNTFYLNPPIRLTSGLIDIYELQWDAVQKITHYRLWIDGTDITGIIALAGGGVDLDSRQSGNDFLRSSLEISPTMSTAVRNSKSVAVDYWTSMELISRNQFGQLSMPTIASGAIVPQAFWVTGEPSMPSSIVLADPAKNTTGKAWSLAFDVNGPGGLSSIQMIPQAGWSYTFANNSITLRQTSSPFDSVTLDWNREIPEITVTRPAYAVSGRFGTWIFKPAATSDYAQNSIYRGPPVQHGPWNPNASTVFNVTNVLTANTSGVGPSPVRHTKGEWSSIGATFTADYADGPTQVTVTPI